MASKTLATFYLIDAQGTSGGQRSEHDEAYRQTKVQQPTQNRNEKVQNRPKSIVRTQTQNQSRNHQVRAQTQNQSRNYQVRETYVRQQSAIPTSRITKSLNNFITNSDRSIWNLRWPQDGETEERYERYYNERLKRQPTARHRHSPDENGGRVVAKIKPTKESNLFN